LLIVYPLVSDDFELHPLVESIYSINNSAFSVLKGAEASYARMTFLQQRLQSEETEPQTSTSSGDATLMSQINSPAVYDNWFGSSLSISKNFAFVGDPAAGTFHFTRK
jgi:hypothetical protein